MLPKNTALNQSPRGRCPELVEGELPPVGEAARLISPKSLEPRRPLFLPGLKLILSEVEGAGVSRGKS